MKERMVIHCESCKGCGYCADNCPKEAIALKGATNKAGYLTPIVDEELCILCGVCYNVCPDYVYEIY
jgi:2-oxoglutarate ferredoxin oxidoreductase subunit delta